MLAIKNTGIISFEIGDGESFIKFIQDKLIVYFQDNLNDNYNYHNNG